MRALLASVQDLRARMALIAIYSCGLRVSEGVSLHTRDIDSVRMLVHVRAGKGGRDRYVPLPQRTLALDQPGIARGLSLPAHGDSFASPLLKSYRLRNGVLHNPANDRRTTSGVFHVAQGGLPIPDDKKAVPKLSLIHI